MDLTNGAGTVVGLLPGGSTEIEHDNETGRSFVQFPDGFFAGQEFDIDNGNGIGLPVFNGAAFNGLEWVGGTLYGTAIQSPGSPSALVILDPFTGISSFIGPTGAGPISGLAFDESAGVMYGIAGGPAPANLYTIDLGTGAATIVGSTGMQAGSLEFGPDGELYAGGTGTNFGDLFRIDPLTASATLVGNTGVGNLTGLAFREGQSQTDFYQVTVGKKKLHVETATPAAASGEFTNVLDPVIRLWDANGNLVASDDNSGADGRNAKLSFKAPKGGEGIYFIEVGASSETAEPTGGEYILSVKGNETVGGGAAAVGMAIGDVDFDGVFGSSDLIRVFQTGEYEDGVSNNSSFEEGDWNRDGDFDSSDLVLAFKLGRYDGDEPIDEDLMGLADVAANLDALPVEDERLRSARTEVTRLVEEIARETARQSVNELAGGDSLFDGDFDAQHDEATEELARTLLGDLPAEGV